MSHKTYFMWTLTLPIGVGLLGLVLPSMGGVTFLMAFAAIPYVVCATVLVVLIRRSRTIKQMMWLTIFAPILMGVFVFAFIVAIDPSGVRSVSRLFQLTSIIPISAIFAYCYVALAWLGFAFGTKFGLISSTTPPNEAPQPTPKIGAAEV